MHVLLSEADVSMLLFKDEKDVWTSRSAILAICVVSAHLDEIKGCSESDSGAVCFAACVFDFSSEGDDAAEGDDGIGDAYGESLRLRLHAQWWRLWR